MDSLTHIVVGALVGEACLGKSLGKRAMVWGAAAQSLPDIDFVASFWLPPYANLLAHRGITHSFLFAAVASLVLAFLLERRHRADGVILKRWIFFFTLEIFSHLFLDAFNNYGVGWFEPLSHIRISFNAIFVADPFFTLVPAISFLVLLSHYRNRAAKKWSVRLGLGATILYLSYALFNKSMVDAIVEKNLTRQNISTQRYFTTPTAFNNWLWYVVVESKSGYFIGYRSVLDRTKTIPFHYFPRQDSLLNTVRDRQEVKHLLRFAQGFHTVTNVGDTLTFNDLRFGQIAGWTNPSAPFVFHYYLNRPGNLLVIQRGRFADWNKNTIQSLVKRIDGI